MAPIRTQSNRGSRNCQRFRPLPGLRAVGVLAILLMAGCSLAAGGPQTGSPQSSSSPQAASSSVAGVPEIAQSEPADLADATTEADISRYFELLATNDPDNAEKAYELAAPKSVAAAYASHMGAAQGAYVDGGGDPVESDLTVTSGTYITCRDGEVEEDCAKWGNVEQVGGRISNFTVDGESIVSRLALGSGDKVSVGSYGSIEFVSAYKSVQTNALVVNLIVRSKQRRINIDSYSATYRDKTGKQVESTDAAGPTELDADSNTRVTVIFARAKPGGVVTMELTDQKSYNSLRGKIKVG